MTKVVGWQSKLYSYFWVFCYLYRPQTLYLHIKVDTELKYATDASDKDCDISEAKIETKEIFKALEALVSSKNLKIHLSLLQFS